MKRGLKYFILGITTFSGGLITGLLLTPKNGRENRKWVSNQSKETKNWIEGAGYKFVKESEKRIDRFSQGIKKTVESSLPDLYQATEDISFYDEDDELDIQKDE